MRLIPGAEGATAMTDVAAGAAPASAYTIAYTPSYWTSSLTSSKGTPHCRHLSRRRKSKTLSPSPGLTISPSS